MVNLNQMKQLHVTWHGVFSLVPHAEERRRVWFHSKRRRVWWRRDLAKKHSLSLSPSLSVFYKKKLPSPIRHVVLYVPSYSSFAPPPNALFLPRPALSSRWIRNHLLCVASFFFGFLNFIVIYFFLFY